MKTTNLQLKDIKEIGFYCGVNDKDRDVIFEIIKNTDEVWLKENPDATLLIDEWIYDYTDNDDRRVYGVSGNLTALCHEKSTCQVVKITDTAYKIYGNLGQYLIEDKPTYKELFKQKSEECESYKKIAKQHLVETFDMQRTIDKYEEDFIKIGQLITVLDNILPHEDIANRGNDSVKIVRECLDIIKGSIENDR